MPGERALPGIMAQPGGVHAAVSRALAGAYARSLELVAANRAAVEEVARSLADATVLDGAAVDRIVRRSASA